MPFLILIDSYIVPDGESSIKYLASPWMKFERKSKKKKTLNII
jgi:hypothetical protein